jgi:hypothetical protein
MIVDAERLARSARRLRWATLLGIAAVLAAMLLGCWVLVAGPLSNGALTFSVDSDGLPAWASALVLLVAGALLVLALLEIVAMLRAVEQGAPFRTGARLRRFASYLFLALLATALLPPLIGWASLLAGAQQQRVTFSLSGEELLMLFVSGLLFFVARLLEAAQSVAEDHEQIV